MYNSHRTPAQQAVHAKDCKHHQHTHQPWQHAPHSPGVERAPGPFPGSHGSLETTIWAFPSNFQPSDHLTMQTGQYFQLWALYWPLCGWVLPEVFMKSTLSLLLSHILRTTKAGPSDFQVKTYMWYLCGWGSPYLWCPTLLPCLGDLWPLSCPVVLGSKLQCCVIVYWFPRSAFPTKTSAQCSIGEGWHTVGTSHRCNPSNDHMIMMLWKTENVLTAGQMRQMGLPHG